MIYTDFSASLASLLKPIENSILSKSCPARPTKGSPCKSSSRPGASPIIIILADGEPAEKTAFLAPYFKSQYGKFSIAAFSSDKFFAFADTITASSVGLSGIIFTGLSFGSEVFGPRFASTLLSNLLIGFSEIASEMPSSACHSKSAFALFKSKTDSIF